MRALFLLLAILNLAYFTWQWQQQGNATQLQNGPIAVAPNTNTLTLLNEVGTPLTPQAAPPRSGSLQETPPAQPRSDAP